MRIEASLEGAEEVMQKLRELSKTTVQKKVKKAVADGADMVRDEAKRLVPTDTGRLRDSIIARTAKRGISGIVIADYPKDAGVRKSKTRKQAEGAKEYYAFAVEYGTRHMAAQPFMRPAMLNKREEVGKLIEGALEEAANDAR